MSLALLQKCSVASPGKPTSTFPASFPASHVFPVGMVPESSIRRETPSATWTASHQHPLQSWPGVAAHWVRWRRRHYFKLRQEIPQLDQWKNFLTLRGMKQTFKGRKILEDGSPAPIQLLNPLSLCENPEEDSAALERWRRVVQSPCHGPNPRLRTLWTLDCSFTPTHLG